MSTQKQRDQHAVYMREYSSRPIPHRKKILSDRKYRNSNLARIRAYDRKRAKTLKRRALKYAYGKKRRTKQRTKILKYHRSYYLKHKQEFADKLKKRRNQFTKAEWKEINSRYGLKHRHGITFEQYQKMLRAQHYRCALCPTRHGISGSNGKLHVDHDHKTERIRGLLCARCNNALERVEKHCRWAVRAAAYLKRPR